MKPRIDKLTKLMFTIPEWGIRSYGGSTIYYNNNLIVSTRNAENKSRLSLYRLKSIDLDFKADLLKPSLLEDHHEYYKESLGQSYPFILKVKHLTILLFTDWYYCKESKKILNRLVMGKFNDEFIIEKLKVFKTGCLSIAGASRAYIIKNEVIFFIPIFEDLKANHPNYRIHIFKFKLRNEETFESFTDKLNLSTGSLLNTNFEKTTCFNILPNIHDESDSFKGIFCARNKNEQYNVFIAEINRDLKRLINISMIKYDESLSYPSIFMRNGLLYMICSLGRYGSNGLGISRID